MSTPETRDVRHTIDGVSEAPSPTPWGTIRIEEPDSDMEQRILDAAFARFAEQGVGSTTMSQLARDADISRVWLYRHYSNRDEVVRALLGREAHRFLVSLAGAFDASLPLPDAVTEVFVFAVETLRGHQLLQRVLLHEPEIAAPFLTTHSGSLLRIAGDAIAALIAPMGAIDPEEARLLTEALLRLALSIVVNNTATVDFDDPEERRAFAELVVRRLVTG